MLNTYVRGRKESLVIYYNNKVFKLDERTMKEAGSRPWRRRLIKVWDKEVLVLLGVCEKWDLHIQLLIKVMQKLVEQIWSSYESSEVTNRVSSAKKPRDLLFQMFQWRTNLRQWQFLHHDVHGQNNVISMYEWFRSKPKIRNRNEINAKITPTARWIIR